MEKFTLQTITSWMTTHKVSLDALIPQNTISIDRFITSVLLELSNKPNIFNTTAESLINCIKEAAMYGLEVGGQMQLIYLTTSQKDNDCHIQISYKGQINILTRSQVKTIDVEYVYEEDIFNIEKGTQPKITHLINTKDERGKIIGYYCIAKLINNETKIAYMSKKEVEAFRNKYVKNYNNPKSAWYNNFDAMAAKIVIKKALKYCPINCEIAGLQKKIVLPQNIPKNTNIQKDEHNTNNQKSVKEAINNAFQTQKLKDNLDINIKY